MQRSGDGSHDGRGRQEEAVFKCDPTVGREVKRRHGAAAGSCSRRDPWSQIYMYAGAAQSASEGGSVSASRQTDAQYLCPLVRSLRVVVGAWRVGGECVDGGGERKLRRLGRVRDDGASTSARAPAHLGKAWRRPKLSPTRPGPRAVGRCSHGRHDPRPCQQWTSECTCAHTGISISSIIST